MGTCGSKGLAFNGSRVMLRPEASKRTLSSLRTQARDRESTVRWEGSQLEGRLTIECFALHLSDTFILADEEVEFFVGMDIGADLVLFVDVVPNQMFSMQSL